MEIVGYMLTVVFEVHPVVEKGNQRGTVKAWSFGGECYVWIRGKGVGVLFVEEEMNWAVGSPGITSGFSTAIVSVCIGNAYKTTVGTVIDHLVGQRPVVWWCGGNQRGYRNYRSGGYLGDIVHGGCRVVG